MPWNENNSGGPWGQSPGGGGGPRRPGGPPKLEDILSQGRDQFGGGLPDLRWILLIGLVLLIAFLGSRSIYQLEPDEIGVELRFGVPKEEFSNPGLHFMFWPVETVEIAKTSENETRIGSIRNTRSGSTEGLMLTGDQNIVDLDFTVLWQITNPNHYLFNVADPDGVLRRASNSAMREVVGRRPAEDIFRDERKGIELEVKTTIQSMLDNYGTGVSINDVKIEDVAPPTEVADAFDEVQRAEQDQDRFQEEARQYSNTKLGQARGRAAQIFEEASAYKDQIVKQAEGEAARFISVYEEYAKAPEVTRKRLFLETMEDVLGRSEKVIIENGAGGTGVVPYLPLPEISARSNSSTGN